MEIKTVSLKDYSSLRVGGEGELVRITSLAELIEALMYAKRTGLRTHILGEGTNTFFGDSPEKMLCIKNEIKGISFEQQPAGCKIQAASGEMWDDVVKLSVEKGLWGLENLSYIPGTVGAAPVQNIGAYGTELADVFVSLSAVDCETLAVVEITKEACNFGYRDSLFKQEKNKYIIVSVTIELSQQPHPVLTYKPLDSLSGIENLQPSQVRELVVATRTAKLPDYKIYPNTGSFFKNPVVSRAQGEALRAMYPDIPLIEGGKGYKIPAAWLVEHIAQMKGVRMGNVGTWPSQPLVIVNYGQADAEEIIKFSDHISNTINVATGIALEREVNYIR